MYTYICIYIYIYAYISLGADQVSMQRLTASVPSQQVVDPLLEPGLKGTVWNCYKIYIRKKENKKENKNSTKKAIKKTRKKNKNSTEKNRKKLSFFLDPFLGRVLFFLFSCFYKFSVCLSVIIA